MSPQRGQLLTEKSRVHVRLRSLENRVSSVSSASIPASTKYVHSVTLTPVTDWYGTAFTMSYSDLIQATIMLILRGTVLKPGIDFTTSGATLTLTTAAFVAGDPAARVGANFLWIYMAKRT